MSYIDMPEYNPNEYDPTQFKSHAGYIEAITKASGESLMRFENGGNALDMVLSRKQMAEPTIIDFNTKERVPNEFFDPNYLEQMIEPIRIIARKFSPAKLLEYKGRDEVVDSVIAEQERMVGATSQGLGTPQKPSIPDLPG